ncbi:MAG: HEAT repeat domain-containing protein [Gammaproteobacteria bacterium]|nr:HEAT repeat domain-containing protein [Gammaproteobacteria bacterium]
MTCAPEERPAIIKRLQASFYYRMQVFLVSLLSEPTIFSFFFTPEENQQRRTVMHAVLRPAWEAFLGEKGHLSWRSGFGHAGCLLAATLSDLTAPLDDCATLIHACMQVLVRYIDAEIEKGQSSFYFSGPLELSYSPLLATPQIRGCLEEKWRAYPQYLLRWIGRLRCPIPSFLEQKIEEASRPHADSTMRLAAARTIGRRGRYASEALQLKLIDLLKDDEAVVRQEVAMTIERLGKHTSEAFQLKLIDLLLNSETIVRQAAAVAILCLDKYTSEAFQLKLIGLLLNSETIVRQAAALSIKRLGKHASEAFQAQLVALLNNDNDAVQEAAVAAIIWLGHYASETTKSALAHYRQRPQNENNPSFSPAF